MKFSVRVSCLFFLLACGVSSDAQIRTAKKPEPPIATSPLLQIIRAEDRRQWNDDLKELLAHEDAKVRKRAALAAGRIGDGGAVPVLADMVLMDRDVEVRRMAAFALGEIESPGAAYALTAVLKRRGSEMADPLLRARAVEALGKIVAAVTGSAPGITKPDDEWLDIVRAAIIDTLRFESSRRSQPDRVTILLALTAVLRAKPDGAGKLVSEFLDYSDSRIVADALNTLARLRLKEGNEKARGLLKHNDPVVRANAARVLGATEEKQAFAALLDRALNDQDLRARVSAIRALGSLKDPKAADGLLSRATALTTNVTEQRVPAAMNEALEIVTTLGLILPNTNSANAINLLRSIREINGQTFTAVEVAFARIAPQKYAMVTLDLGGRPASLATGLAELATIKSGQPVLDASNKEVAASFIKQALDCEARPRSTRPAPLRVRPGMVLATLCAPLDALTVPEFLRAYAAFKVADLEAMLKSRLNDDDVIVRATAAELLGNQPPVESNTSALIAAQPRAMRDADNDAALAILDALAKQKNQEANDAIKTALDSKDHLIRRRAVALLKANGVGDFSDRIGTVQTRNTEANYRRAIARIGEKPTATIVTSKGSFTIEFLPEEAPLTVDNFLQLAKRRYFNGQTIPRVVPNFVIQAGDPRGDQNGGPGYTIRCEINQMKYERAAVGMALSGKDTGGSQWFVTHSPQPHLDGGYTVFGHVIRGMEVVDRIARGDRIVRVVVSER